MLYQNFCAGSYESQSATVDQERTVNFYSERIESPGATTRWALYPTPGVEELSEAAVGPGRAHFAMNGREFAVIGVTLWEIDINGTQTSRGTVALDANPATISGNGDGGDQLFITSGGNGYNYNLTTNTLSQIAALNGKATQGDHLDGYFIALDANTSTFYISNLLDGTTWDTGTDFAQRSAAPDPWKALKVLGSVIWLLGEQTSEVWYNAGTSFPFAKHPSGLTPWGISAAFSVRVSGQDILWLGTSKTGGVQVLRATGFTPERISDYPRERIFGDYDEVSDAIGDTYSERGHTFYLLSFPSEDVTWAWDAETKQWAERGTWDTDEAAYKVWRPRYHAYAFGQHRMLDSETGSVYHMAATLSTDVDGEYIRRLRRAPAIINELERIFYASFELDLEPGLGLASGQGSDPQVMMRFSDDGGKTWSNERMCSAGALGEYSTRVVWHRLGSARRRVFEISMTDPINWRIGGAYLNFTQAPSRAA